MPTVDLLYPRRRCPSTDDTLLCPDLTRLVVCLPADVAHDPALLTTRLAEAVGPHIAAPTGWLDGGHQFMIWHPTDPTEAEMHSIDGLVHDRDEYTITVAGVEDVTK